MNAKRPNVVFILADDMGYGDPQCYNAESLIPTAHIDRLASEGVRFTDAHSGCALCTPTRYGIMTGRCYWRTPKRHSLVMPYEPPVIPEERLTLATIFRESGYRTGCIGKWHLGLLHRSKKLEGFQRLFTTIEDEIDFSKEIAGGPIDLGFDYFFGTAGCSTSDAPYCYIRNRHTVAIPTARTSEQMNAQPGVYPGLMAEDWDQETVDTTFAAEACGFIDRHVREHADKPFFLYYALSAPHIPWLTPKFIRGTSREGPRGDMNALVDWCVGEVRATLEKNAILDDTLVVFTSDNGPQKGQNGHDATGGLRGLKNSPYEGGHRIPFIVRWPGSVASGTTSDDPLSLTDMMATFADLLDYDVPANAGEDSFSVLRSIAGRGKDDPRPCLIADTGWHASEIGNFSMRRGLMKLVEFNPREDQNGQTRYELYDLVADPHEKTDLAASHPADVESLKQLLDRVRAARGMRAVQSSR